VNVTSLVSLQLDDCSPLFVFHDRSVAAPRFLELAHNFLEVQIFWKPLDERKTLARGTLLEMEV
jgi:hypothetical protein